jgi:hypothetical protein
MVPVILTFCNAAFIIYDLCNFLIFTKQLKPVDLYNGEVRCSLQGTGRILK